jgi:hypothetical protein
MRHGQFNQAKANLGRFDFKVESAKKKMANVSIARLRTMFPQYLHLSDSAFINELKREGKL